MQRLFTRFPDPRSHEDLFIQRYGRLSDWAIQITSGDSARAEDLVQDAYIQFTLSRPDLGQIENLDGYLRRILQNLYISQIRRKATKPETSLCATDYDSAELSLKGNATHNGLEARDELRLICEYACPRKDETKAASVLILRFFLGYWPAEIEQILGNTDPGKRTVDRWLALARHEARLFVHQPENLVALPPLIGDRRDLAAGLRRRVWESRQGDCLSMTELRKSYGTRAEDTSIKTEILAHFVSCADCLDRINRLLGLPLLAERHPDDTIGPDTSGSAGGLRLLRGRRSGRTGIRKSGNLLAEIIEHRPKELVVAVNGFITGSQSVPGDSNRLTLKLKPDETTGFIEIFSELNIRLLYLQIEAPPAGVVRQKAQITLSGSRSLELSADFSTPLMAIEVIYNDPDAADRTLVQTFAPALPPRRSSMRWWQWRIVRTVFTIILLLLASLVLAQTLMPWWKDYIDKKQPPATTPSNINKPTASPTKTVFSADLPLPSVRITSEPPPHVSLEIEIEALEILARRRADLHEQIEVTRSGSGTLQIKGIVESAQRKDELVQALSPITESPAVEIGIYTIEEALSSRQQMNDSPVEAASLVRTAVLGERFPAESRLRRYLADVRVREIATMALTRSRQLAQHAGAIRQLAYRFSHDQLMNVESSHRDRWLHLVRDHALQTGVAASELEELNVIAPAGAVYDRPCGHRPPLQVILDHSHLKRTSDDLTAFSSDIDSIVRHAFTLSTEGPESDRFGSVEFRDLLHRVKDLVSAIAQWEFK